MALGRMRWLVLLPRIMEGEIWVATNDTWDSRLLAFGIKDTRDRIADQEPVKQCVQTRNAMERRPRGDSLRATGRLGNLRRYAINCSRETRGDAWRHAYTYWQDIGRLSQDSELGKGTRSLGCSAQALLYLTLRARQEPKSLVLLRER